MPELIQRQSTGADLPILNLSARQGWVVNATPPAALPRETAPLDTVQQTGWPSGTGRTDLEKENLLPLPGLETQINP
jgi:hypothetical protein